MMLEAQAVAERWACASASTWTSASPARRRWGAQTSMLQDLERGRPMEIDALLGVVVELAELVEVPVPTCRTVLSLVRARARVAGCYEG
jgi:2-dehydropantoate 2-reductase